MKTAPFIWIAIFVLLQAACSTEGTADETVDRLLEFQVTSPQSESTEGDFIYRLATDRKQYTEGEEIAIYAELEYTGEQENVEISHAASPFHFPLREETRAYSVGYAMNDPLLIARLTSDDPLRERYAGNGG